MKTLKTAMTTNVELDVGDVERLRSARTRRVVIKTKFVTLRGRCPDEIILVFEGDDDKVVYGRWIMRVRPELRYEVFLCDGKKGVAQLKEMLDKDLGNLANEVYYFIDRDFDDFGGIANDNNVYMTPSYSFENFVVSREVVGSILRDEFPLHELAHVRERILQVFDEIYRDFVWITGQFNWLLFQARRQNIPLLGTLPRRVSQLAAVGVRSVGISQMQPDDAVVLSSPVDSAISSALRADFADLNPFVRYRGKNALMFLSRWLTLLAEEYVSRDTDLFLGCPEGGAVRHAEFTLGSFAAKSEIPKCFAEFVEAIAA